MAGPTTGDCGSDPIWRCTITCDGVRHSYQLPPQMVGPGVEVTIQVINGPGFATRTLKCGIDHTPVTPQGEVYFSFPPPPGVKLSVTARVNLGRVGDMPRMPRRAGDGFWESMGFTPEDAERIPANDRTEVERERAAQLEQARLQRSRAREAVQRQRSREAAERFNAENEFRLRSAADEIRSFPGFDDSAFFRTIQQDTLDALRVPADLLFGREGRETIGYGGQSPRDREKAKAETQRKLAEEKQRQEAKAAEVSEWKPGRRKLK